MTNPEKLRALADWFDKRDKESGSNEVQKDLREIADELDVSGSLFYQIDFGNHLRCKIKVTDNKIEVEGAMNGWGNPVPSNEVIVVELNNLNKAI